MSLLGPEGIAARVAQLQRRIDAFTPRADPQTSFSAQLDKATGPLDPSKLTITPLSGPIGSGNGDLKTMATAAAERHGIDPKLFNALIDQESSWNPSATSKVGAKGLCQLMDGTARDMGVSDSYDPAQSLEGGAQYLRRMLDMNGGDPARALASYNAGFGRVNGRSPAEWPAETRQYVSRIMSRAGGVA